MAFPDIPTAGRITFTLNTAGGASKSLPDISSLTKNAGDLLIAIAVMYDGNSNNAEFSSWGGGLTEFGDFATTTTVSIGCAYKFSTGSEGSMGTVTTVDTSTNDTALWIISIANAHASTPPEAGGYATGTTTTATPNSLSPSWGAEDTLWIAVAGCGETATGGSFTGLGGSAPTNYSDLASTGISADVVGGIESEIAFRQLNAASEDPGNFSNDTSNARWGAITIAVRPAPPSQDVVLPPLLLPDEATRRRVHRSRMT